VAGHVPTSRQTTTLAITAAPIIFAILHAAIETPPVPSTKTVIAGFDLPVRPTSVRHAVTPRGNGRGLGVAPNRRGACVKAVAARTEKCAAKPLDASPGVLAEVAHWSLGSPSCHWGKKQETTWSPGRTPPRLRPRFRPQSGAVRHQYPTVSVGKTALGD